MKNYLEMESGRKKRQILKGKIAYIYEKKIWNLVYSSMKMVHGRFLWGIMM